MRLAVGAVAMLLWQAVGTGPAVETQHLRYQRTVTVPPGMSGQACAVLDADVFAHAGNASLPDVRLASGGREVPFAVTESGTGREETQQAVVLDMGMRGEEIVLRVAMPKRPYTAVVLDLDAKDFVGSAHVFGVADGRAQTDLGTFAVFDLTKQYLSRSTTLALQESAFAQLQVVLHLSAAEGTEARTFGPAIVRGVSVPPTREAQELFTTVAEATSFTHIGWTTVAKLHLPAHVPVERATVVIDPGYAKNFRSKVFIHAAPDMDLREQHGTIAPETLEGEVSQVKMAASQGPEYVALDERQLSVAAVLGANLQSGAEVQIAVHDAVRGDRDIGVADDGPLPVTAVRLEMRQRKICFDAVADAGPYVLRYGDEALKSPGYAYARGFVPAASAAAAVLGAEAMSPAFVARQDARAYWERHPEMFWVGLLMLIGVLGSVMLRGARRRN